MAGSLSDVVREFGRGEATLEMLRSAARAENRERDLASEVLRLIMDWESRRLTHTVRARTDLRIRIEALVPAAPPAPPAGGPAERPRASGLSLYEPGLRGQKRRG
ncbi:MAG: hypothetical protein Q8K79_05115 [Solirubrobacteraceae bacterium]|nr:hypothetical protein [Solirubrobacteraceae bacterium]